MKFTLSWLKDHLDTGASLDEIVRTLTRIGLEVESVDNPAEKLAAFRIARVLTAAPHPRADKLQVLTVDAGSGPCQVVCGAPNARAGLVGVFGAPGAYVPGSGITLKVAAIRGVESNGMMCSSRELELGDDHDGIIELGADAPVGAAYAEWAGLSDPVIDAAITPNRQDCMGVRGIARDLAAAGLGTLKPLAVPEIAGGFASPIEVRTDDVEGCPAFYGRVIRGVSNGASPGWMQARLRAVGQRPISALVDITNYVMLDHGRPSHAYDLAKLAGPVVARRALDGETVTALNGKDYALTSDMTVIADANGVHDIAGIMGGEHSGCGETTTDILLEVAYFTPERIAKTGQALGLTSDARARFERGVDPAFLDDAVAILSRYILDICGGEASNNVRAGTPPAAPRRIEGYSPARSETLGGLAVPEAGQRAILGALGFDVDANWSIGVPTWRRDIDGPADIVEEIVRIAGIDNVASTPLPRAEGVAKPTATPEQMVERGVRRGVAARGLDEAVTWSFIAPKDADSFGGAAFMLDNPISADMAVMRPSLLPSLIAAAARNSDRGAAGVRLFEIGRRYLTDGERPTVGLVLAGLARDKDWRGGAAKGFDVFDAKAEALAALAAAGAPIDKLQAMTGAAAWYHPGRSGRLCLGPKTVLAEFGELHPRLARAFDIDGRVAVAEVFLDAVPPRRAKRGRPVYAPPALQAVTRDFAFVVDKTVAADALLRAVRKAEPKLIADVQLFDVFAGAGIAAGKQSMAVRVTLQPEGQSFTEADIAAISARIVGSAASATGAGLRD